MWLYYALILLSVTMFGSSFALKNLYRRKRGSGLMVSMESSCIGSVAALVVLFLLNGFAFEATPFTLLMATWAALNGMAFTFCSFRALDSINLSLFSVFAMLGGMALPFFQGIFFYGESFTLAKAICVLFIAVALICTVERGTQKKGTIYYVGIFILNGMSGIISKIFTASDLPKASAAGYSIWIAIMTALLSGTVWLVLTLRQKPCRPKTATLLSCYGIASLYGAINKVANFILVFSLAFVDASVQYPMVTGGTMIVSTLLSFFGEQKPTKRELCSVGLAFCGMLFLLGIPIYKKLK